MPVQTQGQPAVVRWCNLSAGFFCFPNFYWSRPHGRRSDPHGALPIASDLWLVAGREFLLHSLQLINRVAHYDMIDFVDVNWITDATEHRDRQATSQVLSELFQTLHQTLDGC